MKLCVILAVYNREALVGRAIRSLLDQTYRDFECIIINDGSSDSSADVVMRAIAGDDRFAFVSLGKNGGYPNACNLACRMTAADWITRLDSDDEYLPNHLERRVRLVESSPHLDYLYGTMKVVGSEWVPDRHDTSKMIRVADTSMGSTMFFRKEVFKKLGGFRNVYGEDGDFLERATQCGFNIRKVDWATYLYYRQEESLTANEVI